MITRRFNFCLLSLMFIFCTVSAQNKENVKFAYFADTHIAEDSDRVATLKRCIEDVNKQENLQFAIFAGDITEFGSDREINLAKKIIDNLNIPYYIVAGNHDSKWSESGCNTFSKVFGYETFDFEKGGIRFIGCNSGPNMRMAPALLPHESLVWMDSIAESIPKEQPVIFINHYPQDTSMLNYFHVINILKKTNIQVILGGHWHNNVKMNYSGIPGMIGRSPDSNKNRGEGYNIITIGDGKIIAQEKIVGTEAKPAWFSIETSDKPRFTQDEKEIEDPYGFPKDFPWLTFDVNKKYPQVKEIWRVQDNSDIGCGAIVSGEYVLYANTQGTVKAIEKSSGKQIWSYQTKGKIFSTPDSDGKRVVIGSADSFIYCLNLKNGKMIWMHKCDKSVLASPVIFEGKCYIGASDGVFRCINMKDGTLVWRFDKVKGFVESRPWVDKEYVIFGDWANTLYALNTRNGALLWKWEIKGSRMLSPAAVFPLRIGNSVYITTPQRKTYAIDTKTGCTKWSADGGRESIGASYDNSKVFVKTMFNTIIAFNANPEKISKAWQIESGLGYDISPTPTACFFNKKTGKEYLYVPTDKGNIFCFNAIDGSLIWKHKISLALINSILPVGNGRLLISTMDGVITMLETEK